jgi:hypothetical protein
MNYLVITAALVADVQFQQVRETGPAFLRYNLDNTKTFVKWEGVQPDCVTDILAAHTEGSDYWGPYTREDFMALLSGSDWRKPSEELA